MRDISLFEEFRKAHIDKLNELRKKIVCAGSEVEVDEAISDIFNSAIDFYSNLRGDDGK